MNKNLQRTLIVIVVILGIGYFFRSSLVQQYKNISASFYPCTQPLTYHIGSIDPGFNVSQSEFADDINVAAAIWEKTMNKKLFTYSSSGSVKINLIYDARQQTTDTLGTIGTVIDTSKTNYDTLNSTYQKKVAEYARQKISIENAMSSFQANNASYEQEVSYWNSRGGADKNQYDLLQNKKMNLEQDMTFIQNLQQTLNQLVQEVNSLAEQLNQMARELNTKVQTYNTIGASTGKEFNEGEYIEENGTKTIAIYQFDTKARLIRVLAHELGHALGLNHVDDPKAIMYKLNSSENIIPTSADMTELKTACQIPLN